MEFSEKLQELRKSKGLTQEELAQAIYVSRTAISKWESGRGYPSIDSLKTLSAFFSVTIDDLLSGEKLLSIAESENRSRIRAVCGTLFGFVDLMTVIPVILPLYPDTTAQTVGAVDLLHYAPASPLLLAVHWTLYGLLMAAGAAKLLLYRLKAEKGQKLLMILSVVLGILTVLVTVLTREPYAAAAAFLLLILKCLLLLIPDKNLYQSSKKMLSQ